MDYGIKIAKRGKSIDSTEMKDFSLHSSINTLKIYMSGLLSPSVYHSDNVGEYDTNRINHRLGYKPMVLYYYEHPDTGQWNLAPSYNGTSHGSTWNVYGCVSHFDDNSVDLKISDGLIDQMPSSPTTIRSKYYIMADPRIDAWFEPAESDTDNGSYQKDYGLKIARPNINVLTAEPKNLVFSSGFPTLKIYKQIYFDEDLTRSDTNVQRVKHGLSYPPTYIPFMERKAFFFLPDTLGSYEIGTAGYLHGGMSNVYVDSEYIYYNYTAQAYIILCIDPLNE